MLVDIKEVLKKYGISVVFPLIYEVNTISICDLIDEYLRVFDTSEISFILGTIKMDPAQYERELNYCGGREFLPLHDGKKREPFIDGEYVVNPAPTKCKLESLIIMWSNRHLIEGDLITRDVIERYWRLNWHRIYPQFMRSQNAITDKILTYNVVGKYFPQKCSKEFVVKLLEMIKKAPWFWYDEIEFNDKNVEFEKIKYLVGYNLYRLKWMFQPYV